MIVWLASYPKSGNTWLRTILNQLLFSEDIDESKVFETLDVITSFLQQKHFKNISKKLTDSKYTDHDCTISSNQISMFYILKMHKVSVYFNKKI